MPKKARELSALHVKRLSTVGRHPVGGVDGLLLRVTDTGARSWVLRVSVGGGRRRDFGLGGYPTVTLSEARDLARETRAQLKRGIDPAADRKAAQAALQAAIARRLTFKEAAERFLPTKTTEFRNPKHIAQWRSTLEAYVFPTIGRLAVAEIELAHVVSVLEPIWWEKTETASRVRGRIEEILNWARVSGYRDGENPARWRDNLDAVLPSPMKIKQVTNYAAVSLVDLPRWWADLSTRSGTAARALQFLALTAARSGEVRGARWDEIQNGVWTVPSARLKGSKLSNTEAGRKRDHRVPLCREALRIIAMMPHESDYVFPGTAGEMSDMTLAAVMKRMHASSVSAGGTGFLDRVSKRPAVPHGLRSSFRDWAAEISSFPSDMAEMALAHPINNATEAAYRRGDMMEKRRDMMNAWASFLRGSSE